MVTKNNKTCILCGTKYTFCNRCDDFDHLPRWMGIYCSDNCRKIFMALTDYNANEIDKETAASILKKSDLSKKDNYCKFNQDCVEKILSEDNKSNKSFDAKKSVKSDTDINAKNNK